MRTTNFIDELRAKNIVVFLENGKVKVDADQSILTDDLLLELRTRKAEILDYLTNLTLDTRQRLNEFILRGVVFFPELNDCDVLNAELLTQAEKDFLQQNQAEILYFLQFAAIWKYAPEQFRELQNEVKNSFDSRFEITKRFYQSCYEIETTTEQGNGQKGAI